jgi:ribokinase
MTAKVAVVGSLNMDLIIRANRIPQPGETILGGRFHTAPGGKGANQAVAAARLGGQVSMIGRIGEDAFGKALRENLDMAGVDTRYIVQDPQCATGVALIVVDDAGENSIVVASGANMKLTPADVEASAQAIRSADVLLLQLESPLEVVQRAAQIARTANVTVVLNPAPARLFPPEFLQEIDILIPNESETALLTGLSVDNDQAYEEAAEQLLSQGLRTVVLTLGDRGALLTTPEGSMRIPSFHVDPIDTIAAGDAFVGGFGVALSEGKSLPEAVRWGNAAGALATTRLGAQPSLPARQKVESLINN